MKIIEKEYGEFLKLGIINTDKFKTDYFSVSYMMELNEENISGGATLAAVLGRGTEKYKNITDINRHLMSLYDADIGAYTVKTVKGLALRVTAGMLDTSYALDDADIFSGVLDFIYEMLYRPLVKDGALDKEYTESEKKRLIERIKAEINNKDAYALRRANEHAYAGSPIAISENGTEKSARAVSAKSLYKLLKNVTERCPVYAVFAGNFTPEKERALDAFLGKIKEGQKDCAFLSDVTLPHVSDKVKEITETVSAKQGRMVLNFSIPRREASDAAPMIFDEIFGASPVSRLFTNVRERLSLCYYCSSGYNMPLSRFIVRSGLDKENKGKAYDEIMRQIGLLSSPENISDEELMMAKKSRISAYTALGDSPARYAEWYVSRCILGVDTDAKKMISAINAVTKEDVAAVASDMKLELNYFLDGNEK